MPLDSRQTQHQGSIARLDEVLRDTYEYYWNCGQSHFFYRPGVGSVHTRSFLEQRNKNLLFILPGRGESSLKYCELSYELRGHGFDIVVVDHRGQGFSERGGVPDTLGHVNNWEDYVGDIQDIVEHFKENKKYNKTIVLAHSMGGAISLAAKIKNPLFCDGMILSSPMLRVNTLNLPGFVAKAALGALTSTKLKTSPVPFYRGQDALKDFGTNNLTSCLERYQFFLDIRKKHPQINVGAPTTRWVYEALKLNSYIWKKKPSLECGILIMQAGEEKIVCNETQDQFAREVNNCRVIKLKDSRHEILQERDDIRNRALVQVHKFLKEIA